MHVCISHVHGMCMACVWHVQVGIYDPEKLATVDFLNRPELLVNLVMEAAVGSHEGMLKMKEVTAC